MIRKRWIAIWLLGVVVTSACLGRTPDAATPQPSEVGPCAGLAADACGDAAWHDVQEARSDLDRGWVMVRLSHACEMGHVMSCFRYGALGLDGWYGPVDDSVAAEMLQLGCEAEIGSACDRLGILYGRGQGVPLDHDRAIALYEKACGLGDIQGCANLGGRLILGLGMQPDYERAYAVNQHACDGGHGLGCQWLGHAYRHGRGPDQDIDRAATLFAKACDMGGAFGCGNLGALHFYGTLGQVDDERAKEAFLRGCRAGRGEACEGLGTGIVLGRFAPVHGWPVTRILEQACRGRYGIACYNLGTLYRRGEHVEADPVVALSLYERACELGAGIGCNSAGWMWAEGVHAPADPERARLMRFEGCRLGYALSCREISVEPQHVAHARTALAPAAATFTADCEQADAMACSAAGRLAALGIGPAQGIASALTLLARACALGEIRDCAHFVWVADEHDAASPEVEGVLDRFQALCREAPESNCVYWLRARLEGLAGAADDPAGLREMAAWLCDAEVAEACGLMGGLALEAGDRDVAAQYLERACLAGIEEACEWRQEADAAQ